MRASDLLRHITVKTQAVIPPGRMLQHLRFLPIFCAPDAQPEFHGRAMYRLAYIDQNRAAEDAWEIECQRMAFIQGELPPPGGITADSKPGEAGEELRDGIHTMSRA